MDRSFLEEIESKPSVTSGTIKSNTGFYIGDCCYALDDETYEKWGDVGYKDDIIKVGDYENAEFIVAGTAYGDGEYYDNYGNRYPVDAGVISAIPYEILEKQETWKKAAEKVASKKSNVSNNDIAKELGGTFFFGDTCDFDCTDGVFDIDVDDTNISIDTYGYDEYDEEEYDEDEYSDEYEEEEEEYEETEDDEDENEFNQDFE